MKVASFTFNPFEENTYVLSDHTHDCVIIDPGCSNQEEFGQLKRHIETEKLSVRMVVNTHCHIDHILGNHDMKEFYSVPLLIPRLEEPVIRAAGAFAEAYGIPGFTEASIDGYIDMAADFTFGDTMLRVLFVPGHSPGHIALYHPEEGTLISGDVLFRDSIGRTDLPGGDADTLLDSIHHKLFLLPDGVTVYPGHGPPTSIGYEKQHNPFCAPARK